MANKTRIYGEEVIKEIVHRYLEDTNSSGDIEYSSIRDFSLELWKSQDSIFTEKLYYQLVNSTTGETSEKIYKNIKLSDDFWRKPQYQGRQIVDQTNQLLSKTVAKSTKRQVNININVDSILETYYDNKTQLSIQLKPLEEYLRVSLQNEEKLEEKLKNKDSLITELKSNIVELEQDKERLQTALYQMFEYSASKGGPLENQLNTGKGKTKRVEQALREAFSGDPSAFYSRFKASAGQKQKEDSNVANMEQYIKNKEEKKYEDEFDFG
jgi:hypothetical protein